MKSLMTVGTFAVLLAACQSGAPSADKNQAMAAKTVKTSKKADRCQKAPLYIAPRLTAGTAIAQFRATVASSIHKTPLQLETDRLEDGVDLLVADVVLCDGPKIDLPATHVEIDGEKIACTRATTGSSDNGDPAVNLVVKTDAANKYSCQLEWMNG